MKQTLTSGFVLSLLFAVVALGFPTQAHAIVPFPFAGQIKDIEECVNGKLVEVGPPFGANLPMVDVFIPRLLQLVDPIHYNNLDEDNFILGIANLFPGVCIGSGFGGFGGTAEAVAFVYTTCISNCWFGGGIFGGGGGGSGGDSGGGLGDGSGGSQSRPSVMTVQGNADGFGALVFRGEVNPNGLETKYWFEYGFFPGHLTERTAKFSAGSGGSAIPIQVRVTGLQSNINVEYRIVAENNRGTSEGRVLTIRTR